MVSVILWFVKAYIATICQYKKRRCNMSILKSNDDSELIVQCDCGCDEGLRLKVEKDDDFDRYATMTYISGHWYKEQEGCLNRLTEKLKKIIAIIRNKDFYYSEVIMSKEDFQEFKNYISGVDCNERTM